MKFQINGLLLLFFTISLLISCQAYQNNLRKPFRLQKDKCFEFDLKKRSKPLQNTLNLLNLFSFEKARSQKDKTFVSFHQRSETQLIAMKEIAVEEESNVNTNNTNSTNSTNHTNKNKKISVYMKNKYNAEV